MLVLLLCNLAVLPIIKHMSSSYLLLSTESPLEGAWCRAATYNQLVERVREVWGEDFDPIFKYKLPCFQASKPQFRSSELGSVRTREVEDNTVGVINESECQAEQLNSYRELGLCDQCYVIIDDNSDFEIWLNGFSNQANICNNLPLHARQSDTFHHVEYHSNTSFEPLTKKLFVFRKMVQQQVKNVKLISCLDKQHMQHDYYVYDNIKDETKYNFVARSSIAVKSLEEEMLANDTEKCYHNSKENVSMMSSLVCHKFCVQSLLSPFFLLRLNIATVLRHTNAREVIFWSSSNINFNEGNDWRMLVMKAQRAWGVHVPVFRYLDTRYGLTYVNIVNVLDYQLWHHEVAMPFNKRELLVFEQPPPEIAHGDEELNCKVLSYDVSTRNSVMRYRKEYIQKVSPDQTLEELVKKLDILQMQDNCKNVRPKTFICESDKRDGFIIQEDEVGNTDNCSENKMINYYNEHSKRANTYDENPANYISKNNGVNDHHSLHSVARSQNNFESITDDTESSLKGKTESANEHYRYLSKFLEYKRQEALSEERNIVQNMYIYQLNKFNE